ncbi:MAG: ATP-binding cassette domain-containing protein [Gammaproteobacteria bacterium]|nr:ATP-binding cassette domain-containing protein [Gammaproteobacteria bacterium]
MANDNLVVVQHLSKYFGSGHTEIRAVDDVSLTVNRGEIILVMGPSGSGKTTFLSMIGGLLKPTGGSIVVDGIDVATADESQLPAIRAQKIGFVFQAFNLLDALNVEENILFPAQLQPGTAKDKKQRAQYLMQRLGLMPRRNTLPQTLSGGEKQRVAIARALINQPPLILADEPTGNLDSKSGQEVLMILHDITHDAGHSVIIVTHDPRVEEIADRILWLEDGRFRDRKSEKHSWVIDPVCGMRIDEWSANLFSDYHGKRYVFCSHRCLDRFMKAPEQYL